MWRCEGSDAEGVVWRRGHSNGCYSVPVVQHRRLSDGLCHVVHVVQGGYHLLRRAKPVQSSNLPHVCVCACTYTSQLFKLHKAPDHNAIYMHICMNMNKLYMYIFVHVHVCMHTLYT